MDQDITKYIAGITFSVLILAVAHEWAYFNIIGEQFQSMMGVYDYFQASTLWLPYVVIAAFIVFVTTILDYRKRDYQLRPAISQNWFIDFIKQDRVMFLFGVSFVCSGVYAFFAIPASSDVVRMIQVMASFSGACSARTSFRRRE
jgi:hypothetical protein